LIIERALYEKGFSRIPSQVTSIMNADVKNYYSKIPKESLLRIVELESIIKSIVGDYELKISYGVPTVVRNGRTILHFGAYKEFISIYPLGHILIEKYQNELKDYKTSRGTIQFQNNKAFPVELIKKIIKDCLKLSNQ